MTKKEVTILVVKLFAFYPTVRREVETVEAYETALMDLEFSALEAAIARLVATEDFLPSVAKLRAGASEQVSGRISGGAEAYEAVCLAVRHIGRFAPLPLRGDPAWLAFVERHREVNPGGSDPTRYELDERQARAVRGVGGWLEVINSEHEPSLRARFLEAYKESAELERGDRAAALGAGQARQVLVS